MLQNTYRLPASRHAARPVGDLDVPVERGGEGHLARDRDRRLAPEPRDERLECFGDSAGEFHRRAPGHEGAGFGERGSRCCVLNGAAARTGQVGDELIIEPPRRLAAVYPFDPLRTQRPASPGIPLSQSDLLVNARGEPRIGSVIEREIESADRIDLIVAFIRWSGLRLVEERLRKFIAGGGQIRVITTTYTGSTERKSIEHLISIGAQVKVSYQSDNTRLHAKAWLFHRESGFSTVFIGSSNLSTSAMLDGVEWNVRLSRVDAPTIVEKFEATFETYWGDSDYELYDPGRDATKFDQAVARAADELPITFVGLEVEPWPHQREMLEELAVGHTGRCVEVPGATSVTPGPTSAAAQCTSATGLPAASA